MVWSLLPGKHGQRYPVMTGAGPGIGYTTYDDPPPRGGASKVFWKYKGQDLITDGLIFSSIEPRPVS